MIFSCEKPDMISQKWVSLSQQFSGLTATQLKSRYQTIVKTLGRNLEFLNKIKKVGAKNKRQVAKLDKIAKEYQLMNLGAHMHKVQMMIDNVKSLVGNGVQTWDDKNMKAIAEILEQIVN